MKRNIPNDLTNETTEDVLQWYSNAKKTSGCGGHFKGEMNDSLQLKYAMELRKRGIYVPKDTTEYFNKELKPNVEIPEGIFNGEGSF